MMNRKLKKIKSTTRDYGERIDSSFNELEYLNVQVSKKTSVTYRQN